MSKNPLDSLPKREFEEDGITALFGDVRYIMPALDTNPDSTLFLTIPLPSMVRRADKKGHTEEEAEMGLYVITDEREIFPCTTKRFTERGVMALIPKLILRQRWQARAIHEYLERKSHPLNPYNIFQAIYERYNYYMDFISNPNANALLSCWVIGTYFFFIFDYYPYIKIGGLPGVGKTKLGTITAGLSFNGQISASETAPTIYRFAQDTRGTMIIDEQEGLSYKSDEYLAYRQILQSGFHSAGIAHRTNRETGKVEAFSTFCAKMIIAIVGLVEVLEQRVFEVILQKSTNVELMARQPKLDSPEWQPIRNNLYLLLMQEWREVKRIYDEIQNPDPEKLSGRIWDLAKPLITVARFIDNAAPEGSKTVEQSVMGFLLSEVERKKRVVLEGEAARVLNALYEILKSAAEPDDYNHVLTVKAVCKTIQQTEEWPEPPSSKSVASVLRNLHLYNDSKRIGKGYHFSITKAQLLEAASRQGIQLGELGEHGEGNERKSKPSGSTSGSKLPSHGSPSAQSSLPHNEPNEPHEPNEPKTETPNNGSKIPKFYLGIKCAEHNPPVGPYMNETTWSGHWLDTHGLRYGGEPDHKQQVLEALARLEQADVEG